MPNPLMHESFLPTIARINTTFGVIEVDGGRDYRAAPRLDHYRARNGSGGWASGTWNRPTTPPVADTSADSNDGAWTFHELCEVPRATKLYLELARAARPVTVTALPPAAEIGAQAAQRFSNLVDALYDADVALHVTGAATVAEMAATIPLESARIASRLAMLRPDEQR